MINILKNFSYIYELKKIDNKIDSFVFGDFYKTKYDNVFITTYEDKLMLILKYENNNHFFTISKEMLEDDVFLNDSIKMLKRIIKNK